MQQAALGTALTSWPPAAGQVQGGRFRSLSPYSSSSDSSGYPGVPMSGGGGGKRRPGGPRIVQDRALSGRAGAGGFTAPRCPPCRWEVPRQAQDPGSHSQTALFLSNHVEIPEVDDPQRRSEHAGQAWGRPTDGDG